MDQVLSCADCGASLQGRHPNARYCQPCAALRTRCPPSNLSAAQGAQLMRWRNRLTHEDMAKRLGVSRSTVRRYFREQGVCSNSLRYPREVVDTVLAVYAECGSIRTQELFPEVRVLSILTAYAPRDKVLRQRKWREQEIIEAARMAGLVSPTAQVQYFARPNALFGSIKALWSRVFRCAPGDVNGLQANMAYRLVRPGTVAVMTYNRDSGRGMMRILWLQMVGQMRPDCPDWIKQAVEILAKFQTWLHNTDDPAEIAAMIDQRELGA